VRHAHVKHLSTCGTLFIPAKPLSTGRLPRNYGAVNAYTLFLKAHYKEGENIGAAINELLQNERMLLRVKKTTINQLL